MKKKKDSFRSVILSKKEKIKEVLSNIQSEWDKKNIYISINLLKRDSINTLI